VREVSSGSFGKVYEAWEVDEDFPNKVGGMRPDSEKIIVKVIKTSSSQKQNL
jgi:hypothetical protein